MTPLVPLFVATLVANAPPGAARPPVAPVRAVSDTYFGVTVSDPYRWMEASSPELTAWMKGQDDFARATLKALPTREGLLKRLNELDDEGDEVGSVTHAGAATYFMKRSRGDQVAKLYVRSTSGGPDRVLLDPSSGVAPGTHASLDDYTPSPDGRLIAFKISSGGSEIGALQVLDVATGKVRADHIDRVMFGGVSWVDATHFIYNRLRALPADAPPAERFKGITALLHTLGEDAERDVTILGPGTSKGLTLTPEMFPLGLGLPGGHVMGVLMDGVRPEKTYVVATAKGPPSTWGPWTQVADPDADEVTWVEAFGDDLYLLTHHGAPHFKVLKTRLSHPDLAHATVVVPESERILQSIVVGKDALYVSALEGGLARLLRVPHGGTTVETVPLPFDGRLRELSADATAPGAWFELSSWAVSARLESYDPATQTVRDTGLLAPSRADFSGVVAEETEARSADGTMVPLSLVHLRSFARDGSHPTWLKGYGSYGRSELPEFAPTLLAWLERGGLYAVCHARGGGERGEGWHRAGMLLQKQHTIDDFIGCAEYLIAHQYTSPAHLGGEGASAGGVTIGMAITQRPELFGAALVLVGLSNVLRFEQSENVFNAPEFGTVKTPDGFKALMLQDAYSQVKDGTRFPAVLLTTGVNDHRVAPWQATKMAARLQAASASGKPVLLRVDFDAGHVQGMTREQRDEELADEYAFLLSQLGPAK